MDCFCGLQSEFVKVEELLFKLCGEQVCELSSVIFVVFIGGGVFMVLLVIVVGFVIICSIFKVFGGELVVVVLVVQYIVVGDLMVLVFLKYNDCISLMVLLVSMCEQLIIIVCGIQIFGELILVVVGEIVIGNIDLL